MGLQGFEEQDISGLGGLWPGPSFVQVSERCYVSTEVVDVFFWREGCEIINVK